MGEAPTKAWTKLIGGSTVDFGDSVSTALDGSIYVVGYTDGNLHGQTKSGSHDAFIAKLNSDGSREWTRLVGGSSQDFGHSVTTDKDGSIYIAGTTYSSIDGQPFGGKKDAFVAKFNADGSRVWTKLVGGSSDDWATSVGVGIDGSTYITGQTQSRSLDQQLVNGTSDAFVTKFDGDGSKLWTKLIGSSADDGAKSVSIASDGSIYVAGSTWGNLDQQIHNKLSGDLNNSDGFVVKFNSDGATAWTRLVGGVSNDYGTSVATAFDGSVYLAGSTYGDLDKQVNSGMSDGFIVKFNANGDKTWSKLIGQESYDYLKSISAASDGSIYVAATTDSPVDLLSTFSGKGYSLIARYDANGEKMWSQLAIETSGDHLRSARLANDGSFLIAGATDRYLDGQVNNGSFDTFIAKFNSDGSSSNKGYSLLPSAINIEEGATLTTSVVTANVSSGSILYWLVDGRGINAADFTNGALTGSGVIGTDGKFSFFHPVANDATTEGFEILQIKLFSDAARTLQVGSTVSVSISDTSITPISTYSISPSASSINEGDTLATSISTTGVTSDTSLYYGLSGGGITTEDFSSGALTGQVTVGTNGLASLSHILANDLTIEGAETLHIKLFADAARTIQVGSTASVTIADTSTTPAPTYSLSTSATSLNEGATLTTTTSTTNVASGTTLYYSLSGTGITASDSSAGALTGEGTVGTDGKFSFSHTFANDLTTEGLETIQIKLFSDSARTIQLGATASVTIADTSTTPTPTYSLSTSPTSLNEGATLTTTASTTNVASVTTLYYSLSGTGITAADLSAGALTGSGTVGTDGKFSFSHTLANDLTTELSETLEIKLFSDSARTTQVGSTVSVTIADTSTTPAERIQSLTLSPPSKSALRSGISASSSIAYTVSTGETNLTGVGASLYFDSTQLTVTTAGDPFQKGLLGNAITADTTNADGDPKTDKVLSLTYADFGGNFPGSGTTLPLTLANLNLVPTAFYTGTTLHLKGSPATGFTATGDDLTLGYNASPVVNNTLSALTTNRGRAFSYTVPSTLFSDSDSTLTFSATTATGTALPSWLSFNPTTRTLSGTPTTGGTLNLNLSASDELGSVSTPLTLKVREVQQLSSSTAPIRYQRNKDLTVPINYSTTDGSSSTGLAFKVHFNSNLFSFDPTTGASNKAQADLFQIGAVQQDTADTDNDPTTDRFIPISIASFSGQFPSGSAPSKLADLTFRTADKAIDPLTGLRDTSINFSESSVASGYGFSGTSASLKPLSFSLDVDGDGLVTPLGDGLMVIRYLFGSAFAGDALINKAISPDSPLLGGKSYTSMSATEKASVASLVATNIQQGIDSQLLDVDKDGKTTPLGDGLMVIRRLFGSAFDGAALTSKAISPESPYFGPPADFAAVAANIDALKPTMPVM